MKATFDLFLVISFFIAYLLFGMLVATAVTMGMCFFQAIVYVVLGKKIDGMQWLTFAIIWILGGVTLILQDEYYFKWKPTLVFWILALVFTYSHFFSKTTLIEKMLDAQMKLPKKLLRMLNLSWILFFLSLSVLNLYVMHHYSTLIWAYFKFPGILLITLCFGVLQASFITCALRKSNPSLSDSK